MITDLVDLSLLSKNFYEFVLSKKENVVELFFEDVKIKFCDIVVFKCGYPNEEVYMHLEFYTEQNLKKYHLYEILGSEWIKSLNDLNKVHPKDNGQLFKNDRHFTILFEDEVFECIAHSFDVVTLK
jgi:hypothetical protein